MSNKVMRHEDEHPDSYFKGRYMIALDANRVLRSENAYLERENARLVADYAALQKRVEELENAITQWKLEEQDWKERETKFLFAKIDALVAERDRYMDAFKHDHKASGNGDACAKCGLDLRDPIHRRWR